MPYINTLMRDNLLFITSLELYIKTDERKSSIGMQFITGNIKLMSEILSHYRTQLWITRTPFLSLLYSPRFAPFKILPFSLLVGYPYECSTYTSPKNIELFHAFVAIILITPTSNFEYYHSSHCAVVSWICERITLSNIIL